jgi:hypothetical protein
VESPLPPNISSFVIRFVVDSASGEQDHPPYRGAIRHIQTEEELHFSNWEEAVRFIRRFVPLEPDPDPSSPQPGYS